MERLTISTGNDCRATSWDWSRGEIEIDSVVSSDTDVAVAQGQAAALNAPGASTSVEVSTLGHWSGTAGRDSLDVFKTVDNQIAKTVDGEVGTRSAVGGQNGSVTEEGDVLLGVGLTTTLGSNSNKDLEVFLRVDTHCSSRGAGCGSDGT